MTHFWLRWGVAAAVCAALPLLPARAADPQVVPGRGIGRVFLGMRRADVTRSIGKPKESFALSLGAKTGLPRSLQGDYTEDKWQSATGKYSLQVVYRRGRVVQIETNNPANVAAGNISVASSFADVRALFAGLTVSGVSLGDEAETYYADGVRSGIAFSFTIPDNVDTVNMVATKPDAILVHAAGSPVLPVWEKYVGERDAAGDSRKEVRAFFAQ